MNDLVRAARTANGDDSDDDDEANNKTNEKKKFSYIFVVEHIFRAFLRLPAAVARMVGWQLAARERELSTLLYLLFPGIFVRNIVCSLISSNQQ